VFKQKKKSLLGVCLQVYTSVCPALKKTHHELNSFTFFASYVCTHFLSLLMTQQTLWNPTFFSALNGKLDKNPIKSTAHSHHCFVFLFKIGNRWFIAYWTKRYEIGQPRNRLTECTTTRKAREGIFPKNKTSLINRLKLNGSL